MPKVRAWTTEDFSRRCLERLSMAQEYRERFEPQWGENDQTINNAMGHHLGQFNLTFDNLVELESGEVDSGDSDIGMNYAFKYLRFFHSQLSANPPSVIVRPSSTDPVDRRKADAADRIVRHAMLDKDMQEVVDQLSLNTLLFGTGFLKQVWDKDKGDVHDFDEASMELTMKGDICPTVPRMDCIWIDPDATRWSDVRWVIEKHILPYEEAVFRWPDYEDTFKSAVEAKHGKMGMAVFDTSGVASRTPIEQMQVEIFEMYEKGMPINGMAGRHCFFVEKDGEVLGEPTANPHYQKKLPYHCFTYIDVPNTVFGKSTVEYVSRLQDMLNRLDSSLLDNIQAHNVARLLVHEETQMEDQALSNSGWDWTRWSGNKPPQYINPPTLMADAWRFRDQLVTAIQELYGINDSMMGIQRREQSALSQQTAIEAGTMIHRRLFKKYAMVVQSIYKDYLGLVKEKWSEPRTILVLGKEKAFEAADIKGADISGGFDLHVEYGASLPIDPNLRREAIMLMKDFLIEAGMTPKQIMHHMKLNDLEGIHDRLEMSRDRQREIFEEMLARHAERHPDPYISPREMENHSARLEYAYDYLETSEFKYLTEDEKDLIERHVKEREDMAAKEGAPGGGAARAEVPGMPGVSGAVTPGVEGGGMAPPPIAAVPPGV
jgi:hypothetical protein